MGGALAGFSTANLEEKDYNFRRNKSSPWLANFFANEEDLDGIYTTGSVVLCEGIFDRVALKTVLNLPIIARLTRGVGRDLTVMLSRYVTKVYVLFDNDDAGRLGTEAARKRIGSFASVIPIPYPAKDPANFLDRVGPASFKQHFDAKMELYW
jgi:DNA primase